METTTRKKTVLIVAALLAVLVLTSLACSIGSLTIGKDSATIEVTLNQDQINKLLSNATVENHASEDELLDNITKVEMHDSYIRIFGTGTNLDGAQVSGSYDISFSAENDILKVKIIGVDIPGVTLSDPRIVRANQKIADELTKSVTESNGEVLFKEAVVKEGALKMKVQVNFNRK
jgi:hypothetical protein